MILNELGLHPYLPTIVPIDSCPKDEVFLIPQAEMIRMVAPDGTVIAENIEYHRRQCVMINNLPAPAVGKDRS